MAHCVGSGRAPGAVETEFVVRVVSRRNIFAVVVGVLLAGIPYYAFNYWNYWVEGLIVHQVEIEVGTAAKRAIALAEARVKDTIGTLDHLAGRGINSCDHQDRQDIC